MFYVYQISITLQCLYPRLNRLLVMNSGGFLKAKKRVRKISVRKTLFPKPLKISHGTSKWMIKIKIDFVHSSWGLFKITGKSSPTWRWLMSVMFPSATPPPLAWTLFLLLPATISRNSSVYSWNVSNELKHNEKVT